MWDGVIAADLRYRASRGLRKRVQASVHRESRANDVSLLAIAPSRRLWTLFATPLLLLLAAVIVWGFARRPQTASQDTLIAQEVLASSMRSLIVGPLTDVQSSDRHTVKPWFAGKLDFSPVVEDFAGLGFPQAGGRLDYVAGRPTAALVYRHQQHVINLYTWPTAEVAASAVTEGTYQSYNIIHWTQGGMAYWAVTDMDASELGQFALLIQRGLAPPSPIQ